MAATIRRQLFFPKADAALLSTGLGTLPSYPTNVAPIYDRENVDIPLEPWPSDETVATAIFPPTEPHAPAAIPDEPTSGQQRYLRAYLAKNERLRLSMLWYYTRDILNEHEFLLGLQEKIALAEETTTWSIAVIGLLEANCYVRLAAIGFQLAILPRGESICGHTATQNPGSIFLLPNMVNDWRFAKCPYVEDAGLKAYAGVPLRLQHDSGETVALGTLCVASTTPQEPLTRAQQNTLVRLADWVVADIIHCSRARRQRERRRMAELIASTQAQLNDTASEDIVLAALRAIYPTAEVSLQSMKLGYIELAGQAPIMPSDLEDGLWEDVDFIDAYIAESNHKEAPTDHVVRVISAQCESILGSSLLVVASRDMRHVFDDIDSWFVKSCASLVSEMWHKKLLVEVMKAKDTFLRGFSHQLRTPIHGILSSADLLAEELRLQQNHNQTMSTSTQQEIIDRIDSTATPTIYLDTIKTAGRDLIQIVNNMITLNRWADLATADRHFSDHSIQELETDLVVETQKVISGSAQCNASIFFTHDLVPECQTVRVDHSLLRDSLLPLIINAIQHTSDGVIEVKMSGSAESKELVVDIIDTGCGIHPEDQERIFEAYEKVGVHSAGVGIGLTLASKLSSLVDGSVVLVSSEVGRGSHFRATFRLVDYSVAPHSEAPRAPPAGLPLQYHLFPSKGFSIAKHFAKFLDSNGFTSSSHIDGALTIIDLEPNPEQRKADMDKIPADQVAICLVPGSEDDTLLGSISNVVYLTGPFCSTRMRLALDAAEKLLLSLRSSAPTEAVLVESVESAVPVKDDSGTDQSSAAAIGTGALNNMSHSGMQLIQQTVRFPEADVVEPVTAELASLALESEPAGSVEPTLIVPFPSLASMPKPLALLVDDNAINLRIMEMYCNKRALAYCAATDGQQAVETFVRHQAAAAKGEGVPIQLVLMDLQMPVCDGISATKQIRSMEQANNWGRSVIFIVTGQDGPTDRKAASDAGADDYFVKPVGIKLLDQGVKRHFPNFNPN